MKIFTNKTLRVRILCLLLLIVFSVIHCSTAVSALSPTQKKLLKQGILYYNVDTCATGASDAAPASTIGKVYILGDSVTEKSADAYGQAFQGKNITTSIDASSSRGLTSPGTDGNKLSGLQAIDQDKGSIKQSDTVVIALGTNGGTNKQNVDKTIDAVKAINPDATIYWVDTFALDRPSYNSSVIKPANQAIYSEAKDKKYQVLSWYNIVNPSGDPQNPSGKEADPKGYIDNSDGLGVHPTPKGSEALANMVVSDVAAAAKADTTTPPSGGCCPASSGPSVSGEISPNVGKGMSPDAQQKFQEILVAAGQKFNVDPNFIAAFYYAENARTGDSTNNADSASGTPMTGDGNWREPAPPYGKGDSYGTSTAAASGPFQFIPSTWTSYGVDGNGDGKIEVTDLSDGAFAASKYLAASGGTAGASNDKLRGAALSYNHSDTYAQSVLNTYDYLTGKGSTSVSGSVGGGDCAQAASTTGYQNPLRDVKNLAKLRIDQGVDYGGHGPIYAIGNGVVTDAYAEGSSASGWPGGGWVSYKLTDGPAKGYVVYFAESCNPKVKPGQNVTSNSVICDMDGEDYPWTETGWAASDQAGNTQPLAQQYGGNGCCSTTVGQNFSDLLQSLGAPPGVLTNPPIGQKLPANFPTWK